MKIIVAINPAAGLGRGSTRGKEVLDMLRSFDAEVVPVVASDAPACLAKLKELLGEGEYDALFAVGGDGMVHLAVDALGGRTIPLGIIAVGSGNDIAREFGLPVHDVPTSVHACMEAFRAKRYRLVDALAIEGEGFSTHAMAVLSLGFDAAVNVVTNNLTWPRNSLRYVRALLKILPSWRPYGVRIIADGNAHESAISILAVANTRYIGGGMNIAPSAKPDDGRLEVVIGGPVSKPYLLSRFPLLYVGKTEDISAVRSFSATQVRIEASPKYGEAPPVAMADGEIVGPLPLTITCATQSLQLLV